MHGRSERGSKGCDVRPEMEEGHLNAMSSPKLIML
jgi:hypothetical protein